MEVSIEAIWVTLFLLMITGLVYSAFDYGLNLTNFREVRR